VTAPPSCAETKLNADTEQLTFPYPRQQKPFLNSYYLMATPRSRAIICSIACWTTHLMKK